MTPKRPLSSAKILFIGYGKIAQQTAKKLQHFTKHIFALRKSINTPQRDSFASVDNISKIFEYLPNADHVVCILPKSPDTNGLINLKHFEVNEKN